MITPEKKSFGYIGSNINIIKFTSIRFVHDLFTIGSVVLGIKYDLYMFSFL
jgi:hypothetical protein